MISDQPAKVPGRADPDLTADPAYARLKNHLISSTGLAYYANRDEEMSGLIGRRLAELGAPNCTDYLSLLADGEAGPSELNAIVSLLTIGETYFFRNDAHFEALRHKVIPDILNRRQTERRLRVWSAGCATGAEAYSVSIVLQRDFGPRIADWDIQILGTDINEDYLAHARQGRFGEWALRATPVSIRETCFARDGDFRTIAPEYRRWLSFERHNLIGDRRPPQWDASGFDLILCRNVLIYFNAEVGRRVIARFHESLAPEGWLLLGHAEGDPEFFDAVPAPGATLYRKRGGAPARPPLPPVLEAAPAPPAAPAAESGLDTLRRLADRGDWEAAARCGRELMEKERRNPAVYLHYALVLEQLGKLDECRRLLRQAIYLDRGFALAHYHLGIQFRNEQDHHKAARYLRNALDLLSRMPEQRALGENGVTAGELRQITKLQLQILDRSEGSTWTGNRSAAG